MISRRVRTILGQYIRLMFFWPFMTAARMLPIAVMLNLFLGCGVKGDPLPPLKPSEIGRGQPTYKRATEDLPLPTGTIDQEEFEEEYNEREEEESDSEEEEY